MFLGRDEKTDQFIVIKVFSLKSRKIQRKIKKGDLEYTEQLHGAFLDEAALTNKFDHPHLIEVIECATTPDGTPYFVMPYHPSTLAHELWGSSLPQALGLPIKPERTVMLLKQIYDALMILHHEGIVHRDVKPQNVLLNERGHAVLCDFGHAKNPKAITTQKQKNYGTPPFISPEQKMNPASVDGRANIYSLGAMAYLMLTGKKPSASPVPPVQIDTTIDNHLNDWVMQAMDDNPNNRPTSISGVISS